MFLAGSNVAYSENTLQVELQMAARAKDDSTLANH